QGKQAVHTGEVLVADQLEHVAGPFEQSRSLHLPFTEGSQLPAVATPEWQPRGGGALGHLVSPTQAAVEPGIDMAILQQLHVGKFDSTQRFRTFLLAVEQGSGGPVGNKNVMAAIAKLQTHRLGHLRLTERLILQPEQPGELAGKQADKKFRLQWALRRELKNV